MSQRLSLKQKSGKSDGYDQVRRCRRISFRGQLRGWEGSDEDDNDDELKPPVCRVPSKAKKRVELRPIIGLEKKEQPLRKVYFDDPAIQKPRDKVKPTEGSITLSYDRSLRGYVKLTEAAILTLEQKIDQDKAVRKQVATSDAESRPASNYYVDSDVESRTTSLHHTSVRSDSAITISDSETHTSRGRTSESAGSSVRAVSSSSDASSIEVARSESTAKKSAPSLPSTTHLGQYKEGSQASTTKIGSEPSTTHLSKVGMDKKEPHKEKDRSRSPRRRNLATSRLSSMSSAGTKRRMDENDKKSCSPLKRAHAENLGAREWPPTVVWGNHLDQTTKRDIPSSPLR